MIIVDINFFTTKNIIKEDDCSCEESIEFIKKRYGTENIDAKKLYNDILKNRSIPERWKKDAILYRTNFSSLKKYTHIYKRSKVVNTGVYRVMLSTEEVMKGNLNECMLKINELAEKEFLKIENPLTIVGFKEEKISEDTAYTYIKYASSQQIPENIKLQVTSFDGIDQAIAKNKNNLEEVCNSIRTSILQRIKERYEIQLRYTDETDWFDCWVKV